MANQLLANNAKSTLAVAVTSSGQATLQVQTGKGVLFPAPLAPDYFMVTLDDGSNVEICKCVNVAGDVLTVLRGYENTTAQSSFAINTTKVELRLTADTLVQLRDATKLSGSMMRVVTGVSSFQTIGMPIPLITGSAFGVAKSFSSFRDTQEQVRMSVGNSANSAIEVHLNQPMCAAQAGFRFSTRFGFNFAPSSSHMMIGLVNTTGALAATHNPSSMQNGIVCGYVGSGSGVNLRIYAASSAGAAVSIDCGSNFTVGVTGWYQFDVNVAPNDNNWYYRLRRLDISSVSDIASYFSVTSGNLPSNSAWLTPIMHAVGLVNTACQVCLGGWSLEL